MRANDSSPSGLPLGGRTVVVLGGGRGLGRAVARAVVAQGARVIGADALSGHGGLSDAGERTTFVATDLDSRDGLMGLAEETQRRFAALEAVVLEPPDLEAVVGTPRLEADWESLAGRPLRRAWLASQVFLPGMVAQGSGTLLGLVVPEVRPGLAALAAGQQGLMGLMRALDAEVGNAGVRVLTMALAFDTPAEAAARAAAQVLARPERFAGGVLLDVDSILERAETNAGDNRATRLARALRLSQQLVSLLLDLEAEFDRLPVEVRPMARGAFVSKVGYRGQDVVRALNKLGEQVLRIQASHSGTDTEFAVDYPQLAGLLERLLGYIQSVPEETARLMGAAGAPMPVRRPMAARETVVRELIAVLAEVRG